MMMYVYAFFMMYFSSIFMFCLKRKYFLIMLLSLEMAVVSLFTELMYLLSMFEMEYFFSMVFLSFCVCEGALGLSLLVLMIRVHGNNYILSFNSLW